MRQTIQNNKTEITISYLEDIIQESEEFLQSITKKAATSQTKVEFTIRAIAQGGFDKYAILHKRNGFVLVIPEGRKQDALLYGSWDEALYASKKIVTDGLKDFQPTLSIYQRNV